MEGEDVARIEDGTSSSNKKKKKYNPREAQYIPEASSCGKWLASTYVMFAVFSAFVLSFCLQMIFTALVGWCMSKDRRMRVNGAIFRLVCGSLVVSLNPFWHCKIVSSAKPNPMKGTNVIVMANHLSFSDPFVVSAAVVRAHPTMFIANAWIFNIPFGGWAMRMAGDLAVKFTSEKGGWGVDREQVHAMMEQAHTYVRRGFGLMVYPEGSVSKNGELGGFKNGFFQLAIDEGIDIVPVGTWGGQYAWLPKSNTIQPSRIEVAIGGRVSPQGKTLDDLKAEVQSAILELRDSLPLKQRRDEIVQLQEQQRTGADQA